MTNYLTLVRTIINLSLNFFNVTIYHYVVSMISFAFPPIFRI